MIRAAIEVGNETGCFLVVVCAENIQQAVGFVANLYPGCAVRVKFPLDPDMFFAEDPAVEAGMLALAAPEGGQREGSDQDRVMGPSGASKMRLHSR
jgi:hypothetical protein